MAMHMMLALTASVLASNPAPPLLHLTVRPSGEDSAKFEAVYDAPRAMNEQQPRPRCCFALDGVMSGCTAFDEAWGADGDLKLLGRGAHELRAWVTQSVGEAKVATEEELEQSAVAAFVTVGNAVLEARTTDALSRAERATLFDTVYTTHAWACGADPDSPLSGCGSRPSAAAGAIGAVEEVVRTFGVDAILDLACGDHSWMRHVPLEGLGVRYTGGDLSSVVIARNRIAFPARSFLVVDAVADALPLDAAADGANALILSRHMMYHVATADVLAMLQNVAATRGARWFLATTSINDGVNAALIDFRLAEGRPINLMRPPFCLVAPRRLYRDEETEGNGNFLGLWELRDAAGGSPLPFMREGCE